MSKTTFRTNIDIAKRLVYDIETAETGFQVGDTILLNDDIRMKVSSRQWHQEGDDFHLEIELTNCFPHNTVSEFTKYVRDKGYMY